MRHFLYRLLVALGLCAVVLPTSAAQFLVVVPLKAKQGGTSAIQVTLSAATLPAAKVGTAFSFDFKPYLFVTGDSVLDISQATWSPTNPAQVPAGLALGSNGVLSGTPTAMNENGASFEVATTYKGKTGSQVYVITVNGVALEVVQISAGDYHTCALTPAGGVKCWGLDDQGQLGNDAALSSKSKPVDVQGLTSGVASISAGGQHTCAVTTAGAVKCWGRGSYGQLGTGALVSYSPTPVAVQGLTSGIAAVTTGYSHTCALTAAGGLKCWGRDNYGQLGDNTTLANQAAPVDVLGLTSGVAAVTTGSYHTCAVLASGGVKCWGRNDVGQLGINSYTNKPTPNAVVGLSSGVKQVDAGFVHTCAVMSAGGVKCWGDDSLGQLGNGQPLVESLVPGDVPGLAGITSIAAGDSHTCALTSAGAVYCWGDNEAGQLGNTSAAAAQADPLQVTGLAGVTALTAGWGHTCAIRAGGAKCWGDNSDGQLGIGSTTNSLTPVNVLPQ